MISDQREFLDAMEEKIGVAYRASLCALRYRRNQLSIFNRLPDELLLMILLLSKSEDIHLKMFQYIRLTWVCRRWRMLVLGHAEFWTNINLTFLKAEVAEEIVARSKGAKLSVVMVCRPHHGSKDDEVEHHRLLKEVIGPQFGRVESLDLELCADSWEQTIPIFQLPAPALRQFQLLLDPEYDATAYDGTNYQNFTLPADLFQATAQLRILRLYGAAPSWVSIRSMVHGLRRLKLIVSDSSPVLNILQACPDLELLYLQVEPVPYSLPLESASAAPPSITMPRLSNVTLNDASFLCQIATPLLKRLSLTIWVDAPEMLVDLVARRLDLTAWRMVVIGISNVPPHHDYGEAPVVFQGWHGGEVPVADVGEYDSEDSDEDDEYANLALDLKFYQVDFEALHKIWPALIAQATNVSTLSLQSFHTPEEVELVKHTVRHANKTQDLFIGVQEEGPPLLPVFGDPSVCPELRFLDYEGIFDREELGKELVSLVNARRNGPANIEKIQLVGCASTAEGWAEELKRSGVDVQFLTNVARSGG